MRLLVTVLLLLASACAHVMRPPEENWPPWLDFRRLPREDLRQRDVPFELLRGDGAYRKTYRHPGPFHGGDSVTVIYLASRAEFYLSENCTMGHADMPIGPFQGDPRKVLAPLKR